MGAPPTLQQHQPDETTLQTNTVGRLSCLPLQAANLRVFVLDGDAQALNCDSLLHEDGLVRVHAQLQGLRLLTDLGYVLGDG